MEKKKYIYPRIEVIQLDNEISLALQSDTPPAGPGEPGGPAVMNESPTYFNSEPFKTDLA